MRKVLWAGGGFQRIPAGQIALPVSECFGVICGGMTFTPGLDISREADKSERPVVAYSSVYPVSLILVILLVQGMYLSLMLLGG